MTDHLVNLRRDLYADTAEEPQQGGQSHPPRFTPRPVTSGLDQAESRELVWYTVMEAAALCRRSDGTIRNLVSRYQLPRKSALMTYGRRRQRVMLLPPRTVKWLQAVTLFGERDLLAYPPR